MMFHRQVPLNFFQLDSEPLFIKICFVGFLCIDSLRNDNYKSSSMTCAIQQEIGLRAKMVPPLFTNKLSMKPTICWRTWPSMTGGVEVIQ